MRSLIVEQLASRIVDEVIMEQETPEQQAKRLRDAVSMMKAHDAELARNPYAFRPPPEPLEVHIRRRIKNEADMARKNVVSDLTTARKNVSDITNTARKNVVSDLTTARNKLTGKPIGHGPTRPATTGDFGPGPSRQIPGMQIRDMFDADGNPVGRQTERVSAETGRTRTMNPTRTLTSNKSLKGSVLRGSDALTNPRMVSALPDRATDLATMRRTTPTRIETGFDRAAAGLRNLERNVSNITPRQTLGALGRGAGGAATVAGAGLSGYDIGGALVGDGGEGFFDRPAQTDLAADAATRGAGYEFGPASPYNRDSLGSKAAQYGQNLATGTVDNFKDAISSSGLANLIPAVPLAKMAMSQSMLPFDALRGSEVEYDDTVETDSPDGPITQAGREALVAHRTGDHVGSRSDIEDRIAHARRRRAIAPELERKAMGY